MDGERKRLHIVSVSVSVETRRSDDLYTGASPDGDGVEAERWPHIVFGFEGRGVRRPVSIAHVCQHRTCVSCECGCVVLIHVSCVKTSI